jgi:hypothetical protein
MITDNELDQTQIDAVFNILPTSRDKRMRSLVRLSKSAQKTFKEGCCTKITRGILKKILLALEEEDKQHE